MSDYGGFTVCGVLPHSYLNEEWRCKKDSLDSDHFNNIRIDRPKVPSAYMGVSAYEMGVSTYKMGVSAYKMGVSTYKMGVSTC